MSITCEVPAARAKQLEGPASVALLEGLRLRGSGRSLVQGAETSAGRVISSATICGDAILPNLKPEQIPTLNDRQ